MTDFQLGTDPEFVFVGKDGPVNGGPIYGGGPGRPADGEMSTDGHQWIIEARPDPSSEPKKLVESLRDIFQRHKDDTEEDVSWCAGSVVESKPIGGHIHFSNVSLETHILSALHGIVGQVTMLLEDPKEAAQRRAEYGNMGGDDIRRKNYTGGIRGFEYRTPASWVVSPTIARGVLALAKATIMEELIEGPFSIRNLKGSLAKAVQSINKRKFINADKEHFLNKLDDIWQVVAHQRYWFEDGEEDWVYACALKHIAENHPHWHNDKDMLHRWKIRDKTPKSYFRSKDVPQLPNEERLNVAEAWQALQE